MTTLNISVESIKNFEGKSLVVTGGSSGIGLEIARIAKSKGARVLLADLNPPKDASEGLDFQRTDVTKWSDLVTLMGVAKQKFGAIDMVCPNAGKSMVPDVTFSDVLDSSGNLLEPDYSEFDVNLIGVSNTIKVAIHHMKQQPEGGSIVVTASGAGYSSAGLPIYSASKHGVIGLMRGLYDRLEPFNIRLNCIAPGITVTGMTSIDKTIGPLVGVGFAAQTADFPALASLYLHQKKTWNGRCIYIRNQKFVELESGVKAASATIFGDTSGGKPYEADPKHLEVMKNKALQTLV